MQNKWPEFSPVFLGHGILTELRILHVVAAPERLQVGQTCNAVFHSFFETITSHPSKPIVRQENTDLPCSYRNCRVLVAFQHDRGFDQIGFRQPQVAGFTMLRGHLLSNVAWVPAPISHCCHLVHIGQCLLGVTLSGCHSCLLDGDTLQIEVLLRDNNRGRWVRYDQQFSKTNF